MCSMWTAQACGDSPLHTAEYTENPESLCLSPLGNTGWGEEAGEKLTWLAGESCYMTLREG